MTVSTPPSIRFLREVHHYSRQLTHWVWKRRRGALKTQIAGLLALALLVCWGSYATGSYVAAQQALRERDARFYAAVLENAKMRQAFVLLSHDMTTVGVKQADLGEYAGSLLKQYGEVSKKNAGEDPVQKRISSLEAYVAELQKDKREMTDAIRRTASQRIAALEGIIETTGLSPKEVVQEANKHGSQWVIPISSVMEQPAGVPHREKGTGGPNIPLSTLEYDSPASGKMFMDIEHMVLLSNIVDSLPLGKPIRDAQQMSPFGKRVDPFTHRWAFHPGVDLAGPSNAPIMSTSAGRVAFAGYKAEYGNTVDVDHGHGIVTRYGHMSKIIVHAGQAVKEGQTVGIQGSTGRATGPHLHYEVRYFGKLLNPVRFLDAGKLRSNLS